MMQRYHLPDMQPDPALEPEPTALTEAMGAIAALRAENKRLRISVSESWEAGWRAGRIARAGEHVKREEGRA